MTDTDIDTDIENENIENEKEDNGFLSMLGLGKLENFASMLGIDNLQDVFMGLIEKVLGFFGLGELTSAFNTSASGEESRNDPALTGERKADFSENIADATIAPTFEPAKPAPKNSIMLNLAQ